MSLLQSAAVDGPGGGSCGRPGRPIAYPALSHAAGRAPPPQVATAGNAGKTSHCAKRTKTTRDSSTRTETFPPSRSCRQTPTEDHIDSILPPTTTYTECVHEQGIPGTRALHKAGEPMSKESRLLMSPTSVKTSDSKRLLAQVEATAPGVTDWEGSDVPAVRDDLRALRDIVEGTARGTGEEFFRSLVRRLASAIDVPYAVVAEFADVNTRRARLPSGHVIGSRRTWNMILPPLPATPWRAGDSCIIPRVYRRTSRTRLLW